MSDVRKFTGSCQCGAVRYELTGDPVGINCCHCRQCRKANGSAFATNAGYSVARFKLIEGQAALRAFKSSPGKARYFCGTCGSPIYSHSEASPDMVYVRIGTVDNDEHLHPNVHIHIASKAPWYDIQDDLPKRQEQEDLWF